MTAEVRKVVLITANPLSGSHDRQTVVAALASSLESHGYECRVWSDLATLGSEIGRLREADRLHAVVAAGGDGTVSAVASRCDASTPIAIFPLGTENLLAKHIGALADVSAASKAILASETVQFDCGEANGKLFLVMVGVGFDAAVVADMHSQRRGHIRHWSYAGPIARSIWQYRFPSLEIAIEPSAGNPRPHDIVASTRVSHGVPQVTERDFPVEDFPRRWKARWAFISNVPRYAAGLPIAPWADCTDGRLDVSSFRSGGVVRSLRYLLFVALNRHRILTAFRTQQVERVRIESDEPVEYQIDGDYGGTLPLDVRVLPGRLRLIRPTVM